jgi:hypothetical protein
LCLKLQSLRREASTRWTSKCRSIKQREGETIQWFQPLLMSEAPSNLLSLPDGRAPAGRVSCLDLLLSDPG